jgi:hypothetical protein
MPVAITRAWSPESRPAARAARVAGRTPDRSTRAVAASPAAAAGVSRVFCRSQDPNVTAPSRVWVPRAPTSPAVSVRTASRRACTVRAAVTSPPSWSWDSPASAPPATASASVAAASETAAIAATGDPGTVEHMFEH